MQKVVGRVFTAILIVLVAFLIITASRAVVTASDSIEDRRQRHLEAILK